MKNSDPKKDTPAGCMERLVRPFSELPVGARFEWSPEDAHRHYPGPYQKIATDACIPEEGGYGSYELWPAGLAAQVICPQNVRAETHGEKGNENE